MKSFQQLTTEGETIRTNEQPESNTHLMVGGWMKDLVERVSADLSDLTNFKANYKTLDLSGKAWNNAAHFNNYAPGIYLVSTTGTTAGAPAGLPTGNPLSYAVIITGAGATIRGEIVPLIAGQNKVYRWDVSGNTILQVVTSDMLSAAVALLNETKFAKGTGTITDWKAAGNFNNWESGSYIVGANNQTALNVPAGLSTADAYYAVLLYGVGTEQKGFIAELWQDGRTYVWNVKANTADKIAKDSEVQALKARADEPYKQTIYWKRNPSATGSEYLEIDITSGIAETVTINGGVFIDRTTGATSTTQAIPAGSTRIKFRITSDYGDFTFSNLLAFLYGGQSGAIPQIYNSLKKLPNGFKKLTLWGGFKKMDYNAADLPNGMESITLYAGEAKVTGNIENLPHSLIEFWQNPDQSGNMTGDITYLPRGLKYIRLYYTSTTGNIAALPLNMVYIDFIGGTYTYNDTIGRTWAPKMQYVRLFGNGELWTSAKLNACLYDLGQTTWEGSKVVVLRGTQDASTPALRAALEAKGVTVTINS